MPIVSCADAVQVAEARGSKTTVRFHLFPLTYNLGSWLPAQANRAMRHAMATCDRVRDPCNRAVRRPSHTQGAPCKHAPQPQPKLFFEPRYQPALFGRTI